MRLLNISTLTLQNFNDTELPRYAIASHRWAASDEEVSLQDVQNGIGRNRAGYRKIEGFCAFLRQRNNEIRNGNAAQNHNDRPGSTQGYRDVVEWLWIDTCCIDQTSSAELQEAITSMWKWYKQAYVCLAYLNDVRIRTDFSNSVWFTRGWTLQELLAPRAVIFLDSEWRMFGHKCPYTQCPLQPHGLPQSIPDVLNSELSWITGIPTTVLRTSLALSSCPVAERVRWMRNRRTKKTEDLAYSLLGICEVFMSLIYGEGENAWTRLQDKVSRRYERRIELERPLGIADSAAHQASPGPFYIAVMGTTGSGKSTLISRITGESVEIGDELTSCTSEVQTYSFEYDGQLVYLIDTPGFDHSNRTDSEVLNDIVSWLSALYQQQIKLSGVIYLHSITNNHMTDSMLKYLRVFKKLWGDENLSSVVLGTTMWEHVNEDDGVRRQDLLVQRLEFWGDMTASGARVFRFDNDYDSAMNMIPYILDLHRTRALQIQREVVDENKPIDQTSAGRELKRDLIEQREMFESDLERLHAQLRAQQLRAGAESERLRGELQVQQQQANRDSERAQVYSRQQQRTMQQEMEQAEARYRRELTNYREEMEQVEARYRRELADYREEVEKMRRLMDDRQREFERELSRYRHR